MSDTADRPNERGERVPLGVPIELGHGDFEDSFEMACDMDDEGVALVCDVEDNQRWEAYEFNWRKLED